MKMASKEGVFHGSWVGIFTIFFLFSKELCGKADKKTVKPMEKPLSINLTLFSAVFTFHFSGGRVLWINPILKLQIVNSMF